MDISISLSDKQIKCLQNFASNHSPKICKDYDINNRFTRKPLFIVQDKDYIYAKDFNGISYEGDIEYVWIWDDEEYTEEALRNELNERFSDKYSSIKEDDIDSIIDVLGLDDEIEALERNFEWKNVAYFFTENEAIRYSKYQRHNLKEPRVYCVSCGYRNSGDYDIFYDLLMGLGEKLVQEGNE